MSKKRRTPEEIKKYLQNIKAVFLNGKWVGYCKCKECKKTRSYSAKETSVLIRNIDKAGDYCSSCARLGERNHFFNRSHKNSTKIEISKNRKGKSVGIKNSMNKEENRKKVSKALKEKYDSGKLDYLKKIQRDNIIKMHVDGKMMTKPVSKAEKEIREFLEEEKIKVIPQFPIGTLRYDLFIPSINLIIEYNGDYWHCNPRIYEKNYWNSKKEMYAYELWRKDKIKKNLAFKNGYKFITIWESDYKKDRNKILRSILDYEKN